MSHRFAVRTSFSCFAAILVLFGTASQARAATVATDKAVYGASEVAHVSGSGWAPGEVVQYEVAQTPALHPPDTLYILADESGKIDAGYVVPGHGVAQTFALTASGQTSGSSAQATFSNGNDFATVVLSPVATALLATNKDQYAPGETVLISGSGWAPRETVSFDLAVAPPIHSAHAISTIADDQGRIFAGYYVTNDDADRMLTLTATGLSSGLSSEVVFADDKPGACTSNADCDDSNPCTTDSCNTSSGNCQHNPANGLSCSDGNVCNGNEVCQGSSCRVGTNAAEGTVCGSADSSDCNAQDTCNGSGTCVDRFKAAGVQCRAASGQCDVAETCTGSSAACPADGFASAAKTCTGSSQGGVCDDDTADHCSGSSNACIDGFKSATVTCRDAAGACDVAETCSGSSGACPADAFANATVTCTGTSQGGLCDNDAADHCSGTANTCVDSFKAAGATCRGSAGQCDVAETCSGTSGACPADAFATASVTCTGASQGGLCDNDAGDHCSGTANSCVDVYRAPGFTCRASAGQCDEAETCSGSSGACPADAFASASKNCVGSSQGGVCDNDAADHCTGTSNACVDLFQAPGVVCRGSAGQCDVTETCTGSSGSCPADGFAAASTPCGGSSQGGLCDVDADDHCSGTANSCVDIFRPAGYECRGSVGQCDVAETCSGGSGVCPSDAFAAAATHCDGASQGGQCDDDASDHCTGTNDDCIDVFASSATHCTGTSQGGACNDDGADHCSGSANFCIDEFQPAGTSCGDAATECVAQDACNDFGACMDGGTLCTVTNFLPPVDNNSTFDRKKNSSLPFKFRVVRDSDQQPVSDATAQALLSHLGIFVTGPVQCDIPATNPTETLSASESTNSKGLTYDATADQFMFVWSTKERSLGCYNSQVRLDINSNGFDPSNFVSQIRLR